MTERPVPAYVLLTDAPPILEGGFGCHVLSWMWVRALDEDVRLIVTRRLTRGLSLERIRRGLRQRVLFYPDLSRAVGLGRLTAVRSFLEIVLFLFFLPHIRREIRASGAERIFAFFGGNSWFLIVARCVARVTGLPLDVYLVEDLEESTRIHHQYLVARLARWYEPRALEEAARVFTISPSFAEYLTSKHAIRAAWLPPTIFSDRVEYRAFERQTPDVRDIAFIGALNRPNEDALRDALDVIEEWNKGKNGFAIRLVIMTYAEPSHVQKVIGTSPTLEVLYRPERSVMEGRLANSWAILVPYSFLPDMRSMVTTAFPTKLTDSLPVGRPVFAYAPPYSSVARYYQELRLPLCAHSKAVLPEIISRIAEHDSPSLIERYEKAIREFHSPERLKEILRNTEHHY